MADKDTGQKSLEMRVAELEDKLAQLHISEDEMKTYQKVASKLGAAPCSQCSASPCVAASGQQPCVAAQQQQAPVTQQPCVASSSISPIYYRCYYYYCRYYHCYYYNDCILAQGPSGGGVPGGGGFGGFGT